MKCEHNGLWILRKWTEAFLDGWFLCEKCGYETWFYETEVEFIKKINNKEYYKFIGKNLDINE